MSTTTNSSLLQHIKDNNKEETSKKAIKILHQVVNNIIKHPQDEKYRKLKAEKINPIIDNANGFWKIIQVIGFQTLSSHLELPMTASLGPLAELVGEIEGKPAPTVPKMDTTTGCCSTGVCETENCSSSCCSTDTKNKEKQTKKSGGCCGDNSNKSGCGSGNKSACGSNSEKKKSGGCCSTDSHSHSHSHSDSHSHSHSDSDGHSHSHSHSHGHDHDHDHDHDHSECSGEKKVSQAQKILNENMAEVEKQKAAKKAEKDKIKQKMASSRKEKNSETTTSSVAKPTKFGATIGTLPKDAPKGNGNGGGCC
jgi:hypothetical protein